MGIIRKQTVSGTVYTYLGAILGFITSGVLLPKFFDVEQIGVLSLLISYSVIFSQFGSLGFNASISRLFPYFRNKENSHNGFFAIAFWVTLTGFVISIIALFTLSFFILPSKQIQSPLFAQYFWYIIPLIFFTLFFIMFDNYNKVLYNAVRGIFIKEFLIRLFILVFILFFYFSFISFHGFVFWYVFAYSVPAIIIFLLLIRDGEISFKPQLNFISKELKSNLIQVSLYGIVLSASGIITINIDRIMIESMMGKEGLASVGVYAIGFFYGTLIILPSRALIKISGAVIAEAWKNDDTDTIQSVYHKSCITQYIVGGLLFVGICVNMDNIMQILPNGYSEAKFVIVFIALAYLSDMLSGVSNSILGLSKHYKMQAVNLFIMTVLVIVTNFIFIPIYGIVGAAFASLISKITANILRYVYLKWKFNLEPHNYKFIIVSIIMTFSFFIGYFMPSYNNIIINIAIKSISTAIVFFILVYITKCSDDINSFTKLILAKYLKKKV
jgi:O-antigen/teichoic acid export membrane protein